MAHIDEIFSRYSVSQQANLLDLFEAPPKELDGHPRRHLRVASINAGAHWPRHIDLFDDTDGDSDRYSLPVKCVKFNDVVVTPSGFVVADDCFIYDTNWITPFWTQGRGVRSLPNRLKRNGIYSLDPIAQEVIFVEPSKMEEVSDPVFLFNSYHGVANFAHFMHDTLVQVPTFLELKARVHNITPILCSEEPRFNYGPMSVLFGLCTGYDSSEGASVWSKRKFYRIKELYVPTLHFDPFNRLVSSQAARRLYATLRLALAAVPTGEGKHIYISRSDSIRGKGGREGIVSNMSGLQQMLKDRGFVSVEASKLDAFEYISFFKEGRIFMGIHGAGLLNCLLSPRARLIEIATPHIWGTDSLYVFSKAAGIPSESVRTDPRTDCLDLNILEKYIDEFTI